MDAASEGSAGMLGKLGKLGKLLGKLGRLGSCKFGNEKPGKLRLIWALTTLENVRNQTRSKKLKRGMESFLEMTQGDPSRIALSHPGAALENDRSLILKHLLTVK